MKQLSKAGLLAEIRTEYQRLKDVITAVSDCELTQSRVNSAGWSLKDVLAHVADWADRCAEWCEAGLRGEDPEPPAPGIKWNQLPLLNKLIFERHRRRSAAAVRADFETNHARLQKIAETFDHAALTKPRRFAWTGRTWAVANYIRANTASHYRWALKHFNRWIRQRGTGGASSTR